MFFDNKIKPELYRLLKITIPISLSQFGHVMVGFVDCVLAGNLGKKELAIATVSNAIFFPLLTFVIGMTSGITPLVAYEYGKGDIAEMKKLHLHSFVFNAFLAVFMYLFMMLIGGFVIDLFNEQNIHKEAWSFYSVFLLSIIPIIIFQTFKQYAEAIGYAKLASFVTIAGNVLNVVLSLILVQYCGIYGIAWATFISRLLMALVYVYYFYTNSNLSSYVCPFRINKSIYSYQVFKRMFSISFPFGMQMLVESAAFGTAGLMAVKIGIIEGGAHQIALQIASVVYMISTGLGAASTVRVGQNLGKGDTATLISTAKLTVGLMLVYNVITAILLLVFNYKLSYLFTNEEQIVFLSAHLLLFGASFQFFDGLQVAFMGILRGINDTVVPAILVASAYWLIAIPLGYKMAFDWGLGVDGIWYALVLGLFLVSAVLCVRMLIKFKSFNK